MRNNQKLITIHQISILNILSYVFIFFEMLSIGLFAQPTHSEHFNVIQLTDGVYAAINTIGGQAICNAGIVDLGDKTLIFDTFLSLKAAQDLKNIAEELTSHPVGYVINSHYHSDHIRGNQIFKREGVIISTNSTRTDIAKNEPDKIKQEGNYAPKKLAELKKDLKSATDKTQIQKIKTWLGYFQALVESHPSQLVTLPDITFDSCLTIYGSTRKVELIELGGHTNSDIIMYLPKEKIVFTGDLVFIGYHPFLAESNLQMLRSSLDKLKEMDIEKIVPGHGHVGTKDDISGMNDYIKMIYNLSKDFVVKRKSIDELSKIKIPEPYDDWYLPDFFVLNLKHMYKIISEEINSNKQ